MTIEQKLTELGYTLPETAKPLAAYVPAILINEYVYTSGQLPIIKGELKYKGKLGKEITKEQGYKAATICTLNALSATKTVINDLLSIERIVKIVGYVNSAPGFIEQPAVLNGTSELLKQIFGKNGSHARSAIGVSELPLGASVEVEIIFKVKRT